MSPSDGAYVPNTFTVQFGLDKMGVAPAGVDKPNTGHHHLLIDTALPPFDQPIPNDENHLHYGAGQTQGTVTLPTGKHTLQLLFADGEHIPHDPPVYSKPITVYVGHVAAAPGGARSSAQASPSPSPRGDAGTVSGGASAFFTLAGGRPPGEGM